MQTPMLEGAAQGLVTLIRDDGMFRLPSWVELLISLVIGVLSVNMLLYLPPGRGIFFLVGLVAALSGAVWLALASVHAWVDLAHPLLVAGFSYYLVIPYRLLDEYRKRWHYQEKSELMSQLEQLKSNFLSLISHDLKTPIARIQGNAELVLDQTSSLTDKQKKSLSAIVHTTEDLSEYVESVLDLTRIESAKVPLNKATKDINATILEVVENKQGMAADKQIELVTDLEPIFSFKFDVKLIRRVLGNLVENAIKYSPDGTQITLRSKEEGTWVRVYVEDQGIGIAPEDQERVFAKFYRCENSTTTQNKGTGLGLYLVKYFVELHQGMVELKSEIGKGSVFTVSLPV
jgi:signal transduction histidine kinase